MTDKLYGTDRLLRAVGEDLEVRGSDGRTVYGTLVPYGVSTRIGGGMGYDETFAAGAFAKSITEGAASRAKLTVGHRLELLPIGRATELVEEPSRLVGSFYVSNTADGDDALQRIRDGAVDSFSVEFQPIRSEWNQDRTAVVRREARLFGVSLVAYPAYDGALVTGIRSVAAVADILQRFPDLEQTIEDLISSRMMTNREETEGTPPPNDAGHLPDVDDTPPPTLAGHLSEEQQRALDDLRDRLGRLTTGALDHVGENR